MCLTTGTITLKSPMFHNFVDSNFKGINEIAVKTLQDKEDEYCTLQSISETEAPAQSKLNTPVNQEIEHSNLRVSPLHLDDQHTEAIGELNNSTWEKRHRTENATRKGRN